MLERLLHRRADVGIPVRVCTSHGAAAVTCDLQAETLW